MDGRRQKNALNVINTDERELNQASKALGGLDTRMIPPGYVGERTGCNAEPSLGGRLDRKKIIRPAHQSGRKFRNPRAGSAKVPSPLQQGIECLLSVRQLRI